MELVINLSELLKVWHQYVLILTLYQSLDQFQVEQEVTNLQLLHSIQLILQAKTDSFLVTSRLDYSYILESKKVYLLLIEFNIIYFKNFSIIC